MREETNRYERCLVLAGGGGRLAVHLGTVAAACEAGRAPDVILGTCGGALVAALVHAEPDPARQLAWLGGPAMYRFWRGVRPRPGLSVAAAAAALARRALDPRAAPRIPDLDRDALFEVADGWPELAWRADAATDAVLLGARLLYEPSQAGQARAGRALYQAVAIGSGRSGALLAGAPAGHGEAIAPTLATLSPADMALQDAVRISLTDMVYLPPAAAAGARWLGGAVDLMPVELAARLAREVWIDRKDAVSRWTIGPAWRSTLGMDGRARQRQVDATAVALRIDHRGLARALPDAVLTRRLARTGAGWALQLHAATDAAEYRRVIQAQFDEGRRRARAAMMAPCNTP